MKLNRSIQATYTTKIEWQSQKPARDLRVWVQRVSGLASSDHLLKAACVLLCSLLAACAESAPAGDHQPGVASDRDLKVSYVVIQSSSVRSDCPHCPCSVCLGMGGTLKGEATSVCAWTRTKQPHVAPLSALDRCVNRSGGAGVSWGHRARLFCYSHSCIYHQAGSGGVARGRRSCPLLLSITWLHQPEPLALLPHPSTTLWRGWVSSIPVLCVSAAGMQAPVQSQCSTLSGAAWRPHQWHLLLQSAAAAAVPRT